MCHAARTPPLPDFIACVLLLLKPFRKLQNVLKGFEVNFRYSLFSESSLPVLSVLVFYIEVGAWQIFGRNFEFI